MLLRKKKINRYIYLFIFLPSIQHNIISMKIYTHLYIYAKWNRKKKISHHKRQYCWIYHQVKITDYIWLCVAYVCKRKIHVVLIFKEMKIFTWTPHRAVHKENFLVGRKLIFFLGIQILYTYIDLKRVCVCALWYVQTNYMSFVGWIEGYNFQCVRAKLIWIERQFYREKIVFSNVKHYCLSIMRTDILYMSMLKFECFMCGFLCCL